MEFRIMAAAVLATMLPLVAAHADALSVTCAGTPAASSITWTASVSGGVVPVALAWGNGSTSTSQTIAVAPGTYAMVVTATDASSTVASSTCSATVAAPVSTTTTPSIAAQIQALLAQIAALKAQILQLLTSRPGTATTTPSVSLPSDIDACTIGRDITRGDYGDDVKDLQKFLAKHPNLYPEGIVNGFYGPHTMQAVKRLQKQYGIKETGFFGSMTRTQIQAQCGTQDSDHDGISNKDDQDDDNDGIPDAQDTHPFRADATTTISVSGTLWGGTNGESKHDNGKGKKGHGHDDDREDD